MRRGRGAEDDSSKDGGRKLDAFFYIQVFIGILLAFAGLDLMIMLSKLSRLWGVPVFILGVGLLAFTEFRYGTLRALPLFMSARSDEVGEEDKDAEDDGEDGGAYGSAPVIYWSTLKERLIPFLWVLGLAIIAADLIYNIGFDPKFKADWAGGFGSFDISVTLLGAALIAYRFVPRKYARERDFILVLFVFIFLILILPAHISGWFDPQSEGVTDSPIVRVFLTTPMAFLLNLFGLEVEIIRDENIIQYPLQAGGSARVAIATSCAGIYSQSLFISGFIAYILVEYRRWDIKAALLLVAGVLTAWFANILRMSVIVVIGSYKGKDAFFWAHKYLGTVIFFVWIFIFWGVIFLVLRARTSPGEKAPSN